LAERFQVARNLYGRAPAPRLCVRSAATVLAGDDLVSAQRELDSFAQVFQRRGILLGKPVGTLEELAKLLTGAQFHLLHFACHNHYRRVAPAASQIWLGEEPFEPLFLNEHEDRYCTTTPLVFMNACRSAGQGPQYTKHTGWAHKFVDAGVGAFVGTHWEVRDESAETFAEEFYRALFEDGADLGAALSSARIAIRGKPGDPTWLAYTLYGDPAARVC